MVKINNELEAIERENKLNGFEPTTSTNATPSPDAESNDAGSSDTESEDQDTVLVMRSVLSDCTKLVLKSFFENAIEALDRDEISTPIHLGVIAVHLRNLAETIDPNYGYLAFEKVTDGIEGDPELSDSLHGDFIGEWHTIVDAHLRSRTMIEFIKEQQAEKEATNEGKGGN
jgi:hypothetical protein